VGNEAQQSGFLQLEEFESMDENGQHHDEGGPGALTVSVDDFAALEERIRRTVELVKNERQARAAAEERATTAEAQMRMQTPLLEQLQNELNSLRAERDQVRQRVERLLSQLDALEL
jgi:chromosome segregation ATPase